MRKWEPGVLGKEGESLVEANHKKNRRINLKNQEKNIFFLVFFNWNSIGTDSKPL